MSSFTDPDFTVLSAFTPIRQLASLDRYVPNGGASPLYEGYTSYGYDQATGAVTGIQDTATFAGAGHSIANRTYTRDDAGEVTSATNTTTYPTSATEVSCYAHDGLGELTQVFTPGSGSSCATTPSAAVLGGPAPLWDTYTYDTATGNRASATVHATTGGGSDVTANYTYPAAGAARPHAVSTVTGSAATGAGSYGYDADGNTTSAPGQTLTYNENGKVATVTTGAGTQQDVYSASGSLLLQVDPGGGARLFLGDTVLTKDSSGAVTGVRTYAQDGTSPVERTTTAGVSGSALVWLFSDVDATVDTQTVATSGGTTSQYRDPFGNGIGTSTGVWGDGNGFLNKPASTDTGFTSLGDRFYDGTLGRFTSADPVLAVGNPQQVNGYSYAGNDPITNTDPSGDCYETGAVSDYLTHTTNCAGGHGANKPSAATKRAQAQAAFEATPAGLKELINRRVDESLFASGLNDWSWVDKVKWDPVSDAMHALFPTHPGPGAFNIDEYSAEMQLGFLQGAAFDSVAPEEGGIADAAAAARPLESLSVMESTLRLADHVSKAVAKYDAGGSLSSRELDSAVANPGLAPAYRGTAIGRIAAESAKADPALQHLWFTSQGFYGPDVIDLSTGDWWDITTEAQFQRHLVKYGPGFGPGTGLFTH